VVDFVTEWGRKTGLPMAFFTGRLGIPRSKFYDWRSRYGCANLHNGSIPRDFWLEDWEKEAIIEFYMGHPLDGYRRCCYRMMDADLVAVSPSTVYRVLSQAEAMRRWNRKPSRKGQGFEQPLAPHDHWHVDISYLNICGTFYYLCCVLDGYSRYIVHWDIRQSMAERDVEIVIQRALELRPGVGPRLISDNGPQFIARDFKEFVRISGMTHVRTSPYYPQSNGKIERFHGTIKSECIRPQTPLSQEDARRVVGRYVQHYNDMRLHSAIGYVTPKDKLEHREKEIFARRDQRLQEAREKRRRNRASKSGPSESNAFLGHSTTEPLPRRSGREEPGISAPCGPSEHGEKVMTEGRLTVPPERGICGMSRNPNQTAPAILKVVG
jgi:putative transposase